jgi:hypothetical protein
MKIEINSQPVFNLPLPIGTIRLLIEMSSAHYDGVCKSASMVGGFIYGWNNSVSFSPEFPVSATWRELDTMLKICENTGIFSDRPDTQKVIRELAKAARYAMNQWNQKSSGFCLSLDTEAAWVAQ